MGGYNTKGGDSLSLSLIILHGIRPPPPHLAPRLEVYRYLRSKRGAKFGRGAGGGGLEGGAGVLESSSPARGRGGAGCPGLLVRGGSSWGGRAGVGRAGCRAGGHAPLFSCRLGLKWQQGAVTGRLLLMPTTVGKKLLFPGVIPPFLCAPGSACPAAVVGGGPRYAASTSKRWAAGRA